MSDNMKLIQLYNEIKIHKPQKPPKPHIEVVFYEDESGEYWMDQDKVLSVLLQNFPNDYENIIQFVGEVNNWGEVIEWKGISSKELEREFKSYKRR